LANPGEFYNSRRAYQSYGFQRIYDSADLGVPDGWFEDDGAVIDSVKAALGSDPQDPFFAYVMLIENHGPHHCSPPEQQSFETSFAVEAGFEANCILREYLRRLDSTSDAVESLAMYLDELETRTGRPFVLLVFGDHQPMTFTGYGKVMTDFGPFRRSEDMYETFFHLMSSAPVKINCCSDALPAATLPTLLSTLIADEPGDLYVPENLWLFTQCGSNPIGRDFADRMTSMVGSEAHPRAESCDIAYQRTISSYQGAGIMRLNGNTPER
jgi:hypothetical protein